MCIQKNLPDGTRDLIYEDALARRELEDTLLSLYLRLGYKPIATPDYEFYDVFDHGQRYIKEESIFKFTGSDGRLIALRPDNTCPAARVALSRLKDEPLPLLLCYSQNVYRNNTAFHAKRSQVLQSGVEIIGGDRRRADIRCLFTAIEALRRCGNGKPCKLEIGHAGFFASLLSEYRLREEDAENLRSFAAARNSGGYAFTLRMTDPRAVELAGELPRLCGDRTVLDRARTLAGENARANEILDELDSLCRIFGEAGYGDDLLIDLGIVQKIEYYTGLVFRGYVDGVGEAVLSGGRYDSLLANYGDDIPACGFAFNLSALAEIRETRLPEVPRFDFSDGAAGILRARAYLEQTAGGDTL